METMSLQELSYIVRTGEKVTIKKINTKKIVIALADGEKGVYKVDLASM